MSGTHSTMRPTAQLNKVSLRPLVFVPNIAGLLRPGSKPGLPASQSDAVATPLPVNLVTIEGGSHSTEMPNSDGNCITFILLFSCRLDCTSCTPFVDYLSKYNAFPRMPKEIEVWVLSILNQYS